MSKTYRKENSPLSKTCSGRPLPSALRDNDSEEEVVSPEHGFHGAILTQATDFVSIREQLNKLSADDLRQLAYLVGLDPCPEMAFEDLLSLLYKELCLLGEQEDRILKLL